MSKESTVYYSHRVVPLERANNPDSSCLVARASPSAASAVVMDPGTGSGSSGQQGETKDDEEGLGR